MENLINGRTMEEIKAALCVCTSAEACNLYGCYYSADNDCRTTLMRDVLALIERLESERDAALAKVPKWIDAEERLPEEKESVLVHYADGWMPIAFLLDGKWHQSGGDTSWLSVTHWMYMPEPPKEGEADA